MKLEIALLGALGLYGCAVNTALKPTRFVPSAPDSYVQFSNGEVYVSAHQRPDITRTWNEEVCFVGMYTKRDGFVAGMLRTDPHDNHKTSIAGCQFGSREALRHYVFETYTECTIEQRKAIEDNLQVRMERVNLSCPKKCH